jgi:KDEL-tailed cysteine endopeptidase
MPINTEELKSLWSSWKIYHGKAYGLAEETARFAIFVENYKRVIKFNAENENTKLAMNKFADLTGEEFKNIHAGCFKDDGKRFVDNNYQVKSLPASVDWRTKGAVTPIKNQGQCGSCWSFSTTGALEGFHFISTGTLLSFSEQQIVDCDTQDDGCDGGLPYQAMEYTATAGLETESEYPYTAEDGTCTVDKSETTTTNSGHTMIATKNTNAVLTATVAQPVSVAIEADQDVFQLYSSGVISKGCGDSLDHAVLVVGYNTFSSEQAFIVKNSWGTDWGQAGYVYISTSETPNGGAGVCGILSQPVVPK